MQKVVKKPSRDLTAERSRTASPSTAATACSGLGAGRVVGGHGGHERAQLGPVHLDSGRLQRLGHRLRSAARIRGQRVPGLGADGEHSGRAPGREARVPQRQPQRVGVADEAGVDQGDPLVGGGGGQFRADCGRTGGRAHLEAERAQVGLERRSGNRRTGEDGGRQNELTPWKLAGPRGKGDNRGSGQRAPSPGRGRRHVGREYRIAGGSLHRAFTAPVLSGGRPCAPSMVDHGFRPHRGR